MAGNTAISANPPSYAIDLTVRGSDFLWMVFSVMAATGLGVTFWTLTLPHGKRAFHWCGVAILFTASVAYLAMASNLGKTGIEVEFNRIRGDLYTGNDPNPLRSIWYARYIDWTITTPFLLLTILLNTGLPLSDIMITIFFDLVMIETGLIGALVASRYKWAFFTFGCVAMGFVFVMLIGPARSSARALGADVHSAYIKSAIYLSAMWFIYPIIWGVADGGNVITTDGEMIGYGVLDLLAKPVFIVYHLFAIRNIEYERFQLQSGHFSTGAHDNYVRHVKGENGHSNGATEMSRVNGSHA